MAAEEAENALVELTAELVNAFVANNRVPADELPRLIQTVYTSLSSTNGPAPAPPVVQTPAKKATPAMIRKSITHDALISFEDGRPYKMLRRHLATRGLTDDQYRIKWGLPVDYPMVAPAYSEMRSGYAKAFGLGKSVRQAKKGSAKRG